MDSNNNQVTPGSTAKHKKKFPFLLVVIVIVIIAAAAAVAIWLLNRENIPPIDFEKDNKISLYSVRAANIDPTEYTLGDELNTETEEKAKEYLDIEEENIDAFMGYFNDKIKAALSKNETDLACKLLWRESDLLSNRGFYEVSLRALLNMNTSKLVRFQKVYLYRSIVSAAAVVDDQTTVDKYSALVTELDPEDDRGELELINAE